MTAFQHHSKALYMVFHKTKYCPVVKVDFNKFMYKIFKCNNNDSRKNCRCNIESKGDYRVLLASPIRHKGSLVLVLLYNFDLMVSQESISE